MSKRKMNDFSVFAMHFLKLAQNRKLINRFDREELLENIKAIPNYKTLIIDPDFCDDLAQEYTRWRGSKNLFVLFSLLQKLHSEVAESDGNNEPVDVEDEEEFEDSDGEDIEDGDDEDSSKDVVAGLKKYEDMLAERVNVRAFNEWFMKFRYVGHIGNWMKEKAEEVQLKIYFFRNMVKDYKDRLDNSAYEIFARTLDSLPTGPHKTLLLIVGWLVVRILGMLLLALLIFTRPTILLEKLGIDGEMLPLPE